MRERLACLLLNAVVGTAAGLSSTDPGSALVLLPLTMAIGHAFGHDLAMRWWAPGARLFAVLLGCLCTATLLLGSARLGGAGVSIDLLRALPAYFAPAHLAAWLVNHLRPRRPLRVRGASRLRRRSLEAVARGWGHPFRPALPGEEAEVVSAPQGLLADRSVSLTVGRVRLALHPLGPESAPMRRLKWAMDLLAIGAAVPLLLLLWLCGAVVVAGRTGWPIHHRQIRWTIGQRAFWIWKLRTMRTDAEPAGQPVWPQGRDPRITAPGRILRHLWIDEIPQILNVFLGHMSLVGPRPERPSFAEEFSARMPIYRMRFQVRAGVTGLAQVRGYFGDTSIPRRARWDARYVERWSPLLDLWVLLATALLVVRRSQRRGGEDGQGRGQEDARPREGTGSDPRHLPR